MGDHPAPARRPEPAALDDRRRSWAAGCPSPAAGDPARADRPRRMGRSYDAGAPHRSSPAPRGGSARELHRRRLRWCGPSRAPQVEGDTAVWAMIVKEFRQMRRDRRTLAMLVVLPILLLIVFG